MRSTPASITTEFRSDVGDELRMVAQYDADGLDILYIRDDVESRRSPEELDHLHAELLRENRSGSELEGQLRSGRLRSSMLAFEEFVAFHFISTTDEGYIVSLEPDTAMDITQFMQKFQLASEVEPHFGDIEFHHQPAKTNCPNCGSTRTIATPEAGPESPYYCLDCDRSYQ